MNLTCDDCKSPLIEGSGYAEYLKPNGKVSRRICTLCEQQKDVDHYQKTGEICNRLMIRTVIEKTHLEYDPTNSRPLATPLMPEHIRNRLIADMDAMNDIIRIFRSEIWNSYLRLQIKNSSDRGFSYRAKKYVVMAWSCAGRVLVTIQDRYRMSSRRGIFNGANITLIGAEDGAGDLGIQGIAASASEAIRLVSAVIADHPSFKADSKVTVFGA